MMWISLSNIRKQKVTKGKKNVKPTHFQITAHVVFDPGGVPLAVAGDST